jgi:hypothetical protein
MGVYFIVHPIARHFGWTLNVVFVPTEISQNYAHAIQYKTAKCQGLEVWFLH